MYRVLIVEDDILMGAALKQMVERDPAFQVVHTAITGQEGIQVCKEKLVDLIFLDVQLPGITGLETGRILRQNHPLITIYMISPCSSRTLVRGAAKDQTKDVLEKPVMYGDLKKILDEYKTEHEDSVQTQLAPLLDFLQNRDFKGFYKGLPGLIDEIYGLAGEDAGRLIKMFTYLGQSLLNTRNIREESGSITELFPLNEVLILDRKTSELWLFRVMDFLFWKNSIDRYPLLENISHYVDKHIKEELTLNSIIENCAISQGYLSRIFRERFQVSVTEYIHLRKLHLAKGYFYFTQDSISEIAFRLGYNESSYFSKIFKKFENMTVKEYRNRMSPRS